jgi:AbrB family looped-hinge helix DNA binding protein
MSKSSNRETSKVGKRGTVVIPAKLRKRFGITEGSLIITEETDDGILIRPAVALPIESYSKERIAELILSNAVDAADYASAVEEVKRMGFDSNIIPHQKPE